MDNSNRLSPIRPVKPGLPNAVPPMSIEAINSINNDFIRHPMQYPLEIRKLRNWSWFNKSEEPTLADVGLCFRSSSYIACGSRIEVSIPLRGEAQTFVGTVILVREQSDGFEIGLWLRNDADAARARLVEKICYTECFLETKHQTSH